MDKGANEADYEILIGNEKCEVTHLISNLLTCEPPQSEPNSCKGMEVVTPGSPSVLVCSENY